MKVRPVITPFNPADEWPEPDATIIRPKRPEAVEMSEQDFDTVFGPWAAWIRAAAEVKGAPVDFVALALITTASAIVGNTRWTVPWDGWKEPPIIWGMLVGDPSSGKSPALDAVLDPLREIENAMNADYFLERAKWNEEDEIAKLWSAQWKADVKVALGNDERPPGKPKEASAGDPPVRSRIRITDATTEKAADLLRDNWRGLLLSRDELSGWLGGMDRYNGGGDRPFWLEAFGGRSYSVDRKSIPEPILVEHLSIAVLGGTQPDKLDRLLVQNDDDGLLARYLVIYPAQPPLLRPTALLDNKTLQMAYERLRALEPVTDEHGNKTPQFLYLDAAAQDVLQEFRQQCRDWEIEASGLMKSHIGKLPGLAVRVATVFALLDYARDGLSPVTTISTVHLGRACHYVGEHLRMHAHRSYGVASMPLEVRAASRIAEIIVAESLTEINTRVIQRRGLSGLQAAKEIIPAIAVLESANWIKLSQHTGPGRPPKSYAVNPRVEGQK